MKILFGRTANRFKANLHTHTTISDGCYTPEEVKEKYQARGYSVVAYTDHDIFVPHNDLTDEKFLALNAHEVEINAPATGPNFAFQKTYHLNFYAKSAETTVSPVFAEDRVFLPQTKPYITDEQRKINHPAEYSVESINAMIKTANENGFFVSYNHPVWSLQNYADYIGLEDVWGVEVHNTCGENDGHEENDQAFGDFLRAGKSVLPLATDDNHRPHDVGGGWTVIDAEKLDYASIVNALLNGNFYASNGPRFERIYMEGQKLYVECSDVREIRLTSDRRFIRHYLKKDGEPLTGGDFNLDTYLADCEKCTPSHPAPYVRVTLIDERGNRAYSRAFHLDDIIL